jgi:leader peptidase (prepilin peptidase)/N-methyltransferase
MPLGESVVSPPSHCPRCGYRIPFSLNIPVVTWLWLRGRCRSCREPIPARYLVVEVLTAGAFVLAWLGFGHDDPAMAMALCVLFASFIVATFIDFEHFIIPDEITWGGAAAGVVMSLSIPILHGVRSPVEGAMWSLAGGAFGYLLLWGVVVAGKAAFGKKRITFDKPATFVWRRKDDTATLETDGTVEGWVEFFPDEKAVMRMKCAELEFEGKKHGEIEISSRYEVITVAGKDYDLNKLETFSGKFTEVFFERDAMGFGDVKFMACIGAFLGWKAILFTLVVASTVGALVGIATMIIGRREWSAKIPFGPYLSLGALAWVFYGPQAVAWYWAYTHPAL